MPINFLALWRFSTATSKKKQLLQHIMWFPKQIECKRCTIHHYDVIVAFQVKEIVRSSNGVVQYHLHGHGHVFSIDQDTGQVVLMRPLDREQQSLWEVRVLYKIVNTIEPKIVDEESLQSLGQHFGPTENRA